MDKFCSANKGIDLFIGKYLAGEMLDTARRLFERNARARRSLKTWFGEPDTAEVLDAKYKYATNIEITSNELIFDAVVDCRVLAKKLIGSEEKSSTRL